MSVWTKVPHRFESVFSLEKREGARKISYRYRYRKHGLEIEGVISGRDEKTGAEIPVKEIANLADKEISKKRNASAPKLKSLVRTADLCDEIVALKKSKSPATYEQTEIFFRKHIKPFLIDHCPYAANLNPTVWLNYKNFKRMENPTITLFNHWKFFGMLFRYAYEKGVLEQKFKLDYDEQKEDFRERGNVINDDEFKKFIAHADSTWRDRAICQRLTGQRPGVIRRLRKDRVNLETGVVSIRKEDSKNRREYTFIAPQAVLEIFRRRAGNGSEYFFPGRGRLDQSMDKSLKGWSRALARAGLNLTYTPHDLRHTYLTHKFRDSKNPALVCYQADLSLEEAMRTYIHFRAEDTKPLADDADQEATELLK